MRKISKFRDEIDLKRNPKVMKSLTRVENNYREPGKDDERESEHAADDERSALPGHGEKKQNEVLIRRPVSGMENRFFLSVRPCVNVRCGL